MSLNDTVIGPGDIYDSHITVEDESKPKWTYEPKNPIFFYQDWDFDITFMVVGADNFSDVRDTIFDSMREAKLKRGLLYKVKLYSPDYDQGDYNFKIPLHKYLIHHQAKILDSVEVSLN